MPYYSMTVIISAADSHSDSDSLQNQPITELHNGELCIWVVISIKCHLSNWQELDKANLSHLLTRIGLLSLSHKQSN